ncbi:MAG: GGDEF domain-containing protein [Brevinematia bacterium]
MKIFISGARYYSSPLVTETEDQTMLEIYKTIMNNANQVKEVHTLARRLKDPKFFQKLIFLLTGIQLDEDTARAMWDEIEKYHKDVTNALGRKIHISATVVDYMLRVKHYLRNPSAIELILTEKIENSALQDFFTGLYKGSFFEEFVRKEVNRSKRHNHQFSLVLFQVNGLENVSISGNTSVATKILADIGSIVKYSKRAEDIGFRFSVSKFGLILPQTDKKGAILFSRRLITDIDNAILSTSGLVFGLSLSLGLQTFPEDGDDAKTLVSNVEKACYKAKVMGPNKMVYEL